MNQLHDLAISQGLCRKSRLWSKVGRRELQAVVLDPVAELPLGRVCLLKNDEQLIE